jgi:hypothetical protein
MVDMFFILKKRLVDIMEASHLLFLDVKYLKSQADQIFYVYNFDY